MDTLDGRVLSKVFAQLAPSQYREAATTCRAWSRVISKQRFWVAAFEHMWGCFPEDVRIEPREQYIKRYVARERWAKHPKRHQLAAVPFSPELTPVIDMILSPDRKRLTVVSPSYITHELIGAPDKQTRIKMRTFNPYRNLSPVDVRGYYVKVAAVSFTSKGGLLLGMYDGMVAHVFPFPHTNFHGPCTILSSLPGVTPRCNRKITNVSFQTFRYFVASCTKYLGYDGLCIRVWNTRDDAFLLAEHFAEKAVAMALCKEGNAIWVTNHRVLVWPDRNIRFSMPLADEPKSITYMADIEALMVKSKRVVLILHVDADNVSVAHNVACTADVVLPAIGHTRYAFAAVYTGAGRVAAYGGKGPRALDVGEAIQAVFLDASVLVVSCASALLVYDALRWELLRKHGVPRRVRHCDAGWAALRVYSAAAMVLVRRSADQVHVWNFGAPLAHMEPAPGRESALGLQQLVYGCAEILTTNVRTKADDGVPGRAWPQLNMTRMAAMSPRDLDSALAEMEDEDAAEVEAHRLAEEYVQAVMTEEEMLEYAQMLSLNAVPGMTDADAEAELRRVLELRGEAGNLDASESAQSSGETRDASLIFDHAEPTRAQSRGLENNAITGSNSEGQQFTGAELQAVELQAAIERSLRDM